MSKISISNILTAFNSDTIGSKVTNPNAFKACVGLAVDTHDFSKERVPGQAFIELHEAKGFVSAGVGSRVDDPSAYVVRSHRGRCSAYLKRDHAAETSGCAVVVYTLDAYLADPDVDGLEHARLVTEGATHVLVAVLAFAGPQSPLTPHRFIHNLAGGNREAQEWGADEIRAKAKEILEYDNEWVPVADLPV